MTNKIQVKRGTTNPPNGTLDIGELGYNQSKRTLFVGNGINNSSTQINGFEYYEKSTDVQIDELLYTFINNNDLLNNDSKHIVLYVKESGCKIPTNKYFVEICKSSSNYGIINAIGYGTSTGPRHYMRIWAENVLQDWINMRDLQSFGVTASAAEINKLDGVTASATEINKLDGVTATTAEINVLDGVTASTAEINKLKGLTPTTTELNYVDGVTSNIQTQLNNKVPTSRTINGKNLTNNITLSPADIGAAPLYNKSITSGQTVSFRFPFNQQTCALVTARGWAGPALASFMFSGYGPGGEGRANIHYISGGTAILVSLNKGSDSGHGFSIKANGADLQIGVSVLTGGTPTIEMTEANALKLESLVGHPISNGGTGATDAATALANLGGVQIDHLWTIADTNASVGQVDIPLPSGSFSKYDYLWFFFDNGTKQAFVKPNTSGFIQYAANVYYDGSKIMDITQRAINLTIATDVARIGAAFYKYFNSGWSEWPGATKWLVPYKIYGVKINSTTTPLNSYTPA